MDRLELFKSTLSELKKKGYEILCDTKGTYVCTKEGKELKINLDQNFIIINEEDSRDELTSIWGESLKRETKDLFEFESFIVRKFDNYKRKKKKKKLKKSQVFRDTIEMKFDDLCNLMDNFQYPDLVLEGTTTGHYEGAIDDMEVKLDFHPENEKSCSMFVSLRKKGNQAWKQSFYILNTWHYTPEKCTEAIRTRLTKSLKSYELKEGRL